MYECAYLILLAITLICLNTFYSIFIFKCLHIFIKKILNDLSYVQLIFYLFTCYIDGWFQSKSPFKKNKAFIYKPFPFKKKYIKYLFISLHIHTGTLTHKPPHAYRNTSTVAQATLTQKHKPPQVYILTCSLKYRTNQLSVSRPLRR